MVQSVHDKNKLLYKYEQKSPDKRRRNDTRICSEKFMKNFLAQSDSFHSDYAIVIAKDFEPPR